MLDMSATALSWLLLLQAEIALAEAKAKYKRYELDPYDQPEWYVCCPLHSSTYEI
jgi:hypothetical protein